MQTLAEQQTPPPDSHKLSCTACRKRKVKCDRVYPCTPCIRAGQDCVFPARKRNRKPRRSQQTELLNRLARLESIVGKVDPSALDSVMDGAPSDSHPINEPGGAQAGVPITETGERKPQNDAPPTSDASSKYMSGEFWTNLCTEVEGLKQTLEQPSESDDEDLHDESTPESAPHTESSGATPSYALLGHGGAINIDVLVHPSPKHILFFVSTYFSNVDMIIKVLHQPTTSALIQAFVSSGEKHPGSSQLEALLFVMYFAAITSLTDTACLSHTGEERSFLIDKYRVSAEAALAKADYLNSTSLETLQALTVYIACLRCHGGSRASWALLGLAIRLAHGLGLHCDGDGSKFTPFKAEMRRRLWSQLIVLEVRSVEDRGTEALIAHDSYNTKMTTNIDDADFGPNSTGPVVDQQRPTDVTFSLATAMSSAAFLELYNPQVRFSTPTPTPSQVPTEEQILAHAHRLETTFIDTADPSHLPSSLASRTVHLVILKLWLSMQYPIRVLPPGRAAHKPRVSREDMLRTAVNVMELHEAYRHAPGAERFGWWMWTYVQWHPLAVALAELCSQTEGPLVERAWGIIDAVWVTWSDKIADTKRGTLWRPIKKLLKKAKAARAEAMMRGLKIKDGGDDGVTTHSLPLSKEGAKSLEAGGEWEATAPQLQGSDVALDPALALSNPFSPSAFMLQGSDGLNLDFGQGLDMSSIDAMDWTNWNEFVTDTYADGNEDPIFPIL